MIENLKTNLAILSLTLLSGCNQPTESDCYSKGIVTGVPLIDSITTDLSRYILYEGSSTTIDQGFTLSITTPPNAVREDYTEIEDITLNNLHFGARFVRRGTSFALEAGFPKKDSPLLYNTDISHVSLKISDCNIITIVLEENEKEEFVPKNALVNGNLLNSKEFGIY